jgi:hypothetical protein
MKSFHQILAERVLSPSLSMELNKRERTYIKGKNMYKVVKSLEDTDEPIEDVELRRNIIMCSRENETLVRQNVDGSFSLILNRDENLSAGKSALDGNMSVVEYWPMLKMCIPQGLKINVDDPSFGFPYFDKIYPECKMLFPDDKEKDSKSVGFMDLPPHYYLTEFKFTFHIDVHRLRAINKTFLIKKGQSIANIFFVELPHFRNFGGEIDDIIYIKHDEIFKTFLDVF